MNDLAVLLAPEVKRGKFQLASGQCTDWYVDCRRLTYGRNGGVATRAAVKEMERAGLQPSSIGGVGYGGIPTAVQVAWVMDLPSFAVRAEPKRHGGGGRIVGELVQGPVVLVEDTFTTGGSVASAVAEVQAAGATVISIICLLNRSTPSVDSLDGVPILSLLRPADLGVTNGDGPG